MRRPLAARAAVGVAVLALGAAAGAQAAVPQGADGAAIYRTYCARCHDNPQGRTPSRQALAARSAEIVLLAVNSGSMAFQAQMLNPAEKRAVAEYVSGKRLADVDTAASMCATSSPAQALHPESGPRWMGWGNGYDNARFQASPGFTAADVPNLKLKWAFAFAGGAQAYGHPVIASGRIFVGSDTGRVYALDERTGCAYWSFQADGGVRTAPAVGDGRVFFGDLTGAVYAVDVATGALAWKRKVDDHRYARITGAPVLHDRFLYVPVSSIEESVGGQPTYACCTFRGSIVKLDAYRGEQQWKTYTIAEAPHEVGKNAAGVPMMRPAGGAVWDSPTIDPVKGALYIGVGNAYTEPAAKTTDAIMAIGLKTGRVLWSNQVTPSDAFVIGCRPGTEGCPEKVGPDFDFGTSPVLRTLPGGKRILVVGQKSGMAYGLDPDDQGRKVWEFRTGQGTSLGGIEWGLAADATNAYIPLSDVLRPPAEAGGLFAVNLATGRQVWHTPAPALTCTGGRGCTGAQSAPVSVVPGVVFSGSVDGHLRAYSTDDGRIIWDYNTAQTFDTVNHVPGNGGSIDAAGPAIADGLVVTNSGYALWRGIPGNVLLVFAAR